VTLGLVCRDREAISTQGVWPAVLRRVKECFRGLRKMYKNFQEPKKELPEELCTVPLCLWTHHFFREKEN